ncbi:MAG: hypothetical protein DMF29_09275 [Verrucomicrobia bacterium]|nr:MAG: hypothetical protein DMF29_09275 [Verrucomicrobiota bacterium]
MGLTVLNGHVRINDQQMRKERTVLEVLFPQVRAELLRLLFTAPYKERYVRELMGMSGLRLSTVQDELRKLSLLGLVTDRCADGYRFYRANSSHSLFPHLVRIVDHSERTPYLNHSALHPKRNTRRRRGQTKARVLPRDRPMKWNLFSKRSSG